MKLIMASHRVLSTLRLTLLPADEARLRVLISGGPAFALVCGYRVADGFCPFQGALSFSLDRVRRASDADRPWWTPRLFVLGAENEVIGLGGYKGPPQAGKVELGYSVAPMHQGRGYATEAVSTLASHALTFPTVQQVVAHTLAKPSASTRVLEKCGFKKTEEVLDPEDGLVWRWERT